MTNDNQDALRRADALQRCDCIDFDGDFTASAAHLRRLVAENEEKESALKIVEKTCDDFANQIEAKDALLRQAVEALEHYTAPAQRLDGSPCREPIDKQLCAAIRQHLEGRAS